MSVEAMNINDLRAHYKAVRERIRTLAGMPPEQRALVIVRPPPRPAPQIKRAAAPEPEPKAPMATSERMVGFPGGFSTTSLVYQICLQICEKHDVEWLDITRQVRTARIVAARHEVINTIYEATRWSTPRVGRLVERDHTTVLNSLYRYKGPRYRAAGLIWADYVKRMSEIRRGHEEHVMRCYRAEAKRVGSRKSLILSYNQLAVLIGILPDQASRARLRLVRSGRLIKVGRSWPMVVDLPEEEA